MGGVDVSGHNDIWGKGQVHLEMLEEAAVAGLPCLRDWMGLRRGWEQGGWAGTRPRGWEGESGPGLLPCTHKLGKVVDLAPCRAPLCATGVEESVL